MPVGPLRREGCQCEEAVGGDADVAAGIALDCRLPCEADCGVGREFWGVVRG